MAKNSTPQSADQVKPGTLALAPLPDPRGGCEAALQFQDWMEVAGSVLSDVSELSGQWWKEVVSNVETTYSRWLAATPLERLSITPVGSDELTNGRWTRLNARVSSMLLTAMGESLRSDMVAQRLTQDTVRMVFRLHTTFEPGGSAERHDVLRRLQAPSEFVATESLEDTLKAIRSWPRWLARCKAVNMNPPDASVLARGLMAMSSKHINGSPDAAFRTSMLRTSLRLDGQPSLEQVSAYQRHLQAELETMASAASSTTQALPGLRAIEKATSPKGPKEKGSGAPTDLCRYFLKPSGCKRGSRCTYSHSMASLDKETRSRKCLQCGAEGHRQKDCPVAKGGPRSTTPASPTGKGQRPPGTEAPTVSTMTPCSTPASTLMSSTATVAGTPWTLEALVQAAQQVVQPQGSESREDRSPEKVKPEVRTLVVKDIKISSLGLPSSALLDSGATHSLRNAYNQDEWRNAEDVVVQLAGQNKLTMKLSKGGTLLMPPRAERMSSSSAEAAGGGTIVSMGELVSTLGYTLVRGPDQCLLRTSEGENIPLATQGGCPHLCEAEALALIARLEDRKLERLENEAATTMDRVEMAAMQMDRSWFESLQEYVEGDSVEAGVRSLRDAEFLRLVPGDCLDGLIQGGMFTSSQGPRGDISGTRAGAEGHYQMFHLDDNGTAVIEIDLQRCRGHDLMDPSVWSMLCWGAINGKIDGVLGGPPGRSGVRDRALHEGEGGSKNLKLITRMLWLYAMASAARKCTMSGSNRNRPVALMIEHPAEDVCRGESLWTTPMWRAFEEEMGMSKLTFNQAAMGGEGVKTTVGTNVYYLMGWDQVGLEDEAENTAMEGSSGVWSPGFVSALVLAMKFWARSPRCCPTVSKLSAEQWERHVRSNHADYQKDCLTCVMGRGTGRRHARVRHPDMFALTVDVAGPVKPGLDVSSKGTMGKGLRYMMVAKYVFPREYVKGYTGCDPPEDHGLEKEYQQHPSNVPAEPQLDQEIAGPSLPQPLDGGCDQQQPSNVPAEPQLDQEIAGPSLPQPLDGGCDQQQPSNVPAEPQLDKEIAGPSLPQPHDGGGTQQRPVNAPVEPQPNEEIAGPSLPQPLDGGDPFSIDELESGFQESSLPIDDLQHFSGAVPDPEEDDREATQGLLGGSRRQQREFVDYEDSLYEPSLPDQPEEDDEPGDGEDPHAPQPRAVIQDCEAPESTYLLFARPLPTNGSSIVKGAIQDVILYLQSRGLPVCRLHSDKGEVYCHSIRTWLRDQGIRATFSEPGIPQGNGAAESAVRWLKDKALTLLIGARLPTRLWPTAVEAAAAMQRSRVLGGQSRLLAPYGATVYLKQKAFDSSGPRRRERAFETKWIKGQYVGLSNILDRGHVVFIPASEGRGERFLHTFHVRAGLVDPGGPDGSHLEPTPPKPRRRLPEKTPMEDVELRSLSLSPEDLVEYIKDRSRVLLDDWSQPDCIKLVEELSEYGFFDDLKFGVFRHGGSVGWLKNFKEFPELAKVLSRIILHDHPEATFTAIMVARGNEKGMHRDFNNDSQAVNYVMPITVPKKGGELWVELGPGDKVSGAVIERRDEKDRPRYGQVLPLSRGHCNVFSPRRLHEVLPWEGSRVVLIAYTPQGLGKVTGEMIHELEEFGFAPPLTQYPEYFLLNQEELDKEVNVMKVGNHPQEEIKASSDDQIEDSDVEDWEMFLDTDGGKVKIGSSEYPPKEEFPVGMRKVEVTYTKDVENIIANLKGPLAVTYTADPKEVYEHLDKWAQAICKEVDGVSVAIRRLLPQSEESAEWFRRPGAQRLPAKMVFTIKPGDHPQPDKPETWYKRKARLVVCGNFASGSEEDLYSETAPSEAVRGGLTMTRKQPSFGPRLIPQLVIQLILRDWSHFAFAGLTQKGPLR
ncbi:unnamed protein product [Symbiodinium sp. CCMP2592]|nr:unnamed protein product [Symbiodinium sp. CCMP2592]